MGVIMVLQRDCPLCPAKEDYPFVVSFVQRETACCVVQKGRGTLVLESLFLLAVLCKKEEGLKD